MSATFGVQDTFGLTPPSGFLQESSSEKTAEVVTIRNQNGHTVAAKLKPTTVQKVTIKTKGEVVLTACDQGEFGSLTKITESKYDQSNTDFSTSEVTGTKYY